MIDGVNADAILDFWFGRPRATEPRPEWFRKDAAFDAEISRRFGADLEAALVEPLPAGSPPDAILATLLLCDQFTRNAFRGTARAFSGDPLAQALARRMVDAGDDRRRPPLERAFVYMPFEHAETMPAQDEAVALFERLAEEAPSLADMLDYAKRHRDVIRRFGRFPHRNELLGRDSTAEELEFLRRPGSSF